MSLPEKNALKILESAVADETSETYMIKNAKKLHKLLWIKGIKIPIETIRSYLGTLKSAPINYNRNNERVISELSRPFVSKPAFFSDVHGDTLVLSKLRSYGSKSYFVLVLCDYLSNYTYLESMYSTSFECVHKALMRIFSRSPYLPELCDQITFDQGTEVNNLGIKRFLISNGIKLNLIVPRGPRGSKGSGLAEVTIRKARILIESIFRERKKPNRLGDILPIVEKRMNNESLSCLDGLTSMESLRMDPRYVLMLKHSVRLRRRKYLKLEMTRGRMLPMYCIVRVRLFKKKQLFRKEAYGNVSDNMYIITEKKVNDFVTYYRISNLFTLAPAFDCTFIYQELLRIPISYGFALYHETMNNPGAIVSRSATDITFKPEMSKLTYIATKKMFT